MLFRMVPAQTAAATAARHSTPGIGADSINYNALTLWLCLLRGRRRGPMRANKMFLLFQAAQQKDRKGQQQTGLHCAFGLLRRYCLRQEETHQGRL